MNTYIFGILVGIGVVLDALTKWFATEYLQESFILIPHFLSLQYYQNPGIAFSLPLTGLALKIITCILIFGIFWYYRKHERPKKNILLDGAYVLIFAGALGNAWERIFQGYVTDMLSLEYFAVFNLADSYITLGALLLLLFYWKHS